VNKYAVARDAIVIMMQGKLPDVDRLITVKTALVDGSLASLCQALTDHVIKSIDHKIDKAIDARVNVKLAERMAEVNKDASNTVRPPRINTGDIQCDEFTDEPEEGMISQSEVQKPAPIIKSPTFGTDTPHTEKETINDTSMSPRVSKLPPTKVDCLAENREITDGQGKDRLSIQAVERQANDAMISTARSLAAW
jgi:hypothetical protein